MSSPSTSPTENVHDYRRGLYQERRVPDLDRSWRRHSGFRVAHRWLPGDRATPVLDLGCGPGLFLQSLAESGFSNLTGVDLSPDQIEAARRTCPQAHFEVGDAMAVLNRSPQSFGLIAAFDVIEHFRKDELFPLIDGIVRALRPGGRLIVQTPNAESPWALGLRYGDLTHELAFDAVSLEHLLRRSGLSEFEARECGPYPHGARSVLRSVMWAGLRQILRLWNLVETGSPGSGVYTRVLVATAALPAETR